MADNKPIELTTEGKRKYEEHLKHLVEVERPEMLRQLDNARSYPGDLSDNDDYDIARDKQSKVEEEIRSIQYTLDHCVIIDDKPEKERRLAELREKEKKAESEVSAAKENKNQKSAAYRKARDELEEIKRDIAERENNLSHCILKSRKNELEERLKVLEETMAEHEKKTERRDEIKNILDYGISEEGKAKLQEDMKKLEDRRNLEENEYFAALNAKTRNESLYKDIGRQIGNKERTIGQLCDPSSRYEYTPEEKAKREERAVQLEAEIGELKSDLETAEQAKTEIDAACDSCRDKLKRTKGEIDALKTRLDKSVLITEDTDFEALQREMAKLEESIKTEIDNVSDLSAALNIAVESQMATNTEIKEIHNSLDVCFTVETYEEKSRLEAELDEMKQVKRKAAQDALGPAYGEKSKAENDYQAASKALSEIRDKIYDLEFTIDNFETDDEIVHLGCGAITIRYLASGKTGSVHIVGPAEADPLHGKITNKSELGSALLGHKVGDVVVVKGRREEYEVKILDIDPHL